MTSFYNHSFLRDYPPLGTWLVDEGILTAEPRRSSTLALLRAAGCGGLACPSSRESSCPSPRRRRSPGSS
ncbi:MAG: hypothetical protein R3E53_02620 [Myxococcota bacterium]